MARSVLDKTCQAFFILKHYTLIAKNSASMKRLIGTVLLVLGLVASFITGLDAYQNTESVKILGKQLTLSQADWTPLIASAAVAVVGLVLLASGSAKARR